MNCLDDRLRPLINQRMMALWLPPDCIDSVVRAAIQIPWTIVWSEIEPDRLKRLLNEVHGRTYRVIDNKVDAPPPGTGSDIAFIYDVSVPSQGPAPEILRKRRRSEELENEVEGWSGLLVYAGPADQSANWLELIEALAPSATVLTKEPNAEFVISTLTPAPLTWAGGLVQLFRETSEYLREREMHSVLDLKDANGIEVDATKIESMGDGWELLTRRHTNQPAKVTQQDFDEFLSGDATWEAISAGVAYPRGAICRLRLGSEGQQEKPLDPIDFVVRQVKLHDQKEIDPFDTINQILIFAETGSGCTTLLRQIGLAVAREGYPTLVTTPHPRRLAPESLLNLVIHLQDAWAEARRGRGSGAGTLPVCLILDVDAELPARFGKLMRSLLGDLHRKVVIVRALRRSDHEYAKSRGVLHLAAETNEDEILALGRHLRQFCQDWGLELIPSDNEWRAFYGGFGHVRAHQNTSVGADIETPPLFLIGLYPFVKERVRDERSLEQYLYRRWTEISNASGRQLVEILAAAGAHNIAVPFESLMRDHNLDPALFGRLDHSDQRMVDFFCRWLKFGWQKQNWALYIRHPALGILLTRMIRASEADAPYSALLPVLEGLVGTEGDRWFAEQLAYVLGRRFHSQSRAFSLEIDTAVQRAARAIFQSLPDDVHNTSRSICHHHARFHVHTMHACLGAIEDPNSTRLPEHVVRDLAERALLEAKNLLERARAIPDDREKVSNIVNTLAASMAQLAKVYAERKEKHKAIDHYREAVERANDAVSCDAANGHALFNLINTILHKFEYDLVEEPGEAAELFELSEDRLETLLRLHDNRQWRNANEDETDFMVANLVRRQHQVAQKLNANPQIQAFAVKSGVARIMLKMREIVGTSSLRKTFRDSSGARMLRALRNELRDVDGKSARALLLLYKLYLNDPVGRLEFSTRLDLLSQIERLSVEDYESYRHDRAALYCLTGAFEAGVRQFEQIRSAREADPDRWFWINERLLTKSRNGLPVPKQHVVRITDSRRGWARFENTGVRVKIQPRQFGELADGDYKEVYIRFRLGGLQAVDERMARYDLVAMGYDLNDVDWTK